MSAARLRRLRRLRGQATVETAVLCIVLVPLLLYAFFLDDLLRYKLDEAEAVFSSTWDFTTINYESPGQWLAGPGGSAPNSPQHNIRLGYCDHTTAYNSYDTSFECQDINHHVAMEAHECWIVSGAHQVTCDMPDGNLATDPFGKTITSGIIDKVKQGGEVRCWAQLAVINHFMPQRVLQSFSKVLTTRATEKTTNDTHQAAHEVDGSTAYILKRQNFSLLTDTWAMTTIEDVDPDSPSGVLYDRVKPGYFVPLTLPGFMFAIDAMSDELLSPMAIVDVSPMGDMVITPQLGFSKAAPPTKNDFYSSAWKDKGSNKVESSYNNRGSHYLGRTNIPR